MPSASSVAMGGNFHNSILGMIVDAGGVVQLVLLLLLLFSIASWAIILLKYRELGKVKKENDQFLDLFMKKNKLSDLIAEARKFKYSTVAEVFRVGYAELAKATKAVKPSGADDALSPQSEDGMIVFLERSLGRACSAEASKMEKALGFLATTGNTCPFIGLFGTVWGIMDTFKGIGARGSATLAVVAPGISEALIATAAGLAAAIPAVIFYNYFLNRIRGVNLETDHFASDFLNLIDRYYNRR
ncbi:MAG TPA: MotA/TolQ/ExbB proton channel family protein [Syntrophales bacterium]|nr:MotA/TolQ/ExbB proton channel family protein [Syntrophales bacterium]HQA82514.1 MotA/TolQ/ExbB proton channel family protein [Syntrophales bacterium]